VKEIYANQTFRNLPNLIKIECFGNNFGRLAKDMFAESAVLLKLNLEGVWTGW